jgi:hypothetical protein
LSSEIEVDMADGNNRSKRIGAQITRLSLTDQEATAELLLSPAPPGPALTRAFAAHRELIPESK